MVIEIEELATGERAYEQAEVVRRSVIQEPPSPNNQFPTTFSNASDLFWMVQTAANAIEPWGIGWRRRDAQLRKFLTEENIFAAALGIICSRNAGFSWTLNGPDRAVTKLQHILETANMGKGWRDLIVKTTIDLCSQDNGAFWEIVRAGDSERSPLIGINHLDAARCTHTGVHAFPVIYQDMYSKFHLLPWYNVLELSEMPVPIEGLYGLQYCTLTRLLRRMQSTVNMDVMDYEKSGGLNANSIHLVKGITSKQLKEAIDDARGIAINKGNTRYMDAVVVGTIDPKSDVGHDTIELKTKPSDFDPEVWFKHYINLIAMAFESDYQDFAPLPGGGLGTGAQSEMLHLKSRGKGPATFMNMVSYVLNFLVLPNNTKFVWDEQDLEAEQADAEVRAIRAQTRAVRVASFEITPEISRQIANDEGDLAAEYIDMMGETDLTPDVTVDNETTAESQLRPAGQVRGNMRHNADARQPARVPSIRPPTPLNAKRPAQMDNVKTSEVVERKITRDADGRIESVTETMSDGALESSLEAIREMIANNAKQATKITKKIERDESGRIISVTEERE